MLRIVKWIVISTVALIVLLGIGLVIAAKVIDPNDYKPLIIDQVKKHTGRELFIEGDLSWQLWPPIGISVGKIRLRNTPAFGDEDMIRLEQMVVDVQLLPLLSKSVIVDEVKVDGFYFHRITNEQGETNLDDLLKSEQTPVEPEPSAAEGEAGMALQDIRVGEGITITNALIIDENRVEKSSQRIELKRFSIGQFAFEQWFDVGFEVAAQLSQPAIQTSIAWQSQLLVNQTMDRIQLREGSLLLEAAGATLPKPVSVKLATAVDINLKEDSLVANPLLVTLDNMELSAPFTVTSLSKQPELVSSVLLQPFDGRALLSELGVALNTADPDVLSQVGMEAELNYHSGKSLLSLAGLRITLNDTSITGTGSLKTGDILTSRFNVAIDKLNLDRYLPPPTDAASAESVPDSAEKAPSPDLGFLKTMDVEGKVELAELQANRVILENIKTDLLIRRGKLQIKPLLADIYDGTIRTELTLNANPKVPEFQLQQSINGVQVGPLLMALTDSDTLSGATEFNATISGRSLDPQTIQQTLNGEGRFLFRDGALKGINVAQLIRDAQARLKGEGSAAQADGDQLKKTDFSELKGTFKIVNGVLNNPDFTAYSPLLRVRGNGDVNLPAQQLDYRTKVSVVGTLKGQGGKSAGDLERVTIPLVITGAFADPRVRLDLEGAMKEKAQERLKEEGKNLEDKAKEKFEEKAKDKLGNKLNELLNKNRE